jgi:hypothetical protein
MPEGRGVRDDSFYYLCVNRADGLDISDLGLVDNLSDGKVDLTYGS